MASTYLLVKFLHVVVAVLAGGTSASLGVWLEVFARRAGSRAAVLPGIRFLLEAVVLPGLVLQAVLGAWLVQLGGWSWGAGWLQAAIGVWVGLVLAVAGTDRAVRRMLRPDALADAAVSDRWFRQARLLGGLAGAAFLGILYLMVAKGA